MQLRPRSAFLPGEILRRDPPEHGELPRSPQGSGRAAGLRRHARRTDCGGADGAGDNGTALAVTVVLPTTGEGPVFPSSGVTRACRTPPTRRGSAVHGGVQGADERQVAVALRVVEPVADDELVRDVEADVAHGDRDLGRV